MIGDQICPLYVMLFDLSVYDIVSEMNLNIWLNSFLHAALPQDLLIKAQDGICDKGCGMCFHQ